MCFLNFRKHLKLFLLIQLFLFLSPTSSESGSVKLWDVRKAVYDPYSNIRSSKKGELLCVDAHSQLLVIAW